MHLHTVLTTALIGAATVTATASAHAALPATSPRVVQARQAVAAQSRAEVRVNDFLRDYRQAVLHKGTRTPGQVRAKYLTAGLDKRLDVWARQHDADPVFRAQNVPAAWSMRYEGSGAGHSTVVLTERWAGGAKQDVWYQVQLSDLAISDLQDPSA